MRRLRAPLAAGLLLLAIAATLAARHGRLTYGTTNDEPLHLAAARELRSGPGVVSNLEHPVVMKLLAAAGLAATPPPLLVEETRDGRRLFPFVLGGLVLAAGAWAARRAGALAGLAAGALVALDPTTRGHAAIVHNDVLQALLLVLAGLLLDAVPRAGRARRALVAAAGAVYGVAIATKFSALPFFAVFFVVALFRLRTLPPATPTKKRKAAPRPPLARQLRRALPAAALLGAVALGTAALIQEAALATTSREALRAGIFRQFGGETPIAGDGQETALRWEGRLPKGIAAYAAGLLFVRASTAPGTRFNYLFGKVSGEGFPLYFPIALAVKLPTAVVLGLLAAALLALAGLAGARPLARRRRLRVALGRAWVPALLAAAYLLAASRTDMNIGVRHVLPVVPLGIVAALAGFRPLIRRRGARAALLAAVVAGTALEAGALWGREIPFGNLLVGGPGPGLRRVLSDSNVDWGEGQERLFARHSRGDLGRAGIVALVLNDDEARPLGLVPVEDARQLAALDSVAFSVHLLDLARALPKDEETYRKTVWVKSWLLPIVREADRRVASTEAVGDEYVIYRLRPGS